MPHGTKLLGEEPGSHQQQLLGTNCSGTPIQSTTTLQQSTTVHHVWRSPDVGKDAQHCSTIAYLCIPFLPLAFLPLVT
jgi:hypothetical protein